MKYIREVSDVHLDFDVSKWPAAKRYTDPGYPKPTCDMDLLWYPEPLDGDDDTCMVVAGDIWQARKMLKRKHPHNGKSWMAMMADMFKYVVFVLGNHDYWGTNVHLEPSRVRDAIREQGLEKKVFFLEDSSVVLDQVKFVGGTMWTDFGRESPFAMLAAIGTMNDYRYIRADKNTYRKVSPADLLSIHRKTRAYVLGAATRDSPGQKVVVVTHMAPSYASIHPRYRSGRGMENHFYYSDMDEEIEARSSEIDLWFHGHCHCVSDYSIGSTRVVCNPRGYRGYEDTGWDPYLKFRMDLSSQDDGSEI